MRQRYVLPLLLLACRSAPASVVDSSSPPLPPPVASASTSASPVAEAPWIEIYVASWAIPERLDLSKASDVVLFGIVPGADPAATLTGEKIAKVTNAARAANARVLVCLGGEKTGKAFKGALDDDAFAASVLRFVEKHHLDGVVLDIEPLADVTPTALERLVRALRPAKRLEAVVAPQKDEVARLAPIASKLDRIAIMSYLGGGNDRAFVDQLRAAGVPANRIGLGIDARTNDSDRASRLESMRSGATGGLVFWHAATVRP